MHRNVVARSAVVVGIAGALFEDCGPCVQIASDIAMEQGMPGEIIRALLSGAPTDTDAQLGFDYGRALLATRTIWTICARQSKTNGARRR